MSEDFDWNPDGLCFYHFCRATEGIIWEREGGELPDRRKCAPPCPKYPITDAHIEQWIFDLCNPYIPHGDFIVQWEWKGMMIDGSQEGPGPDGYFDYDPKPRSGLI